ncbi:MAG TPA: metallophosphoesterase family protein [Solirubrobacteraceae bacterium]|jgi:diadenosine tetraphosphatase ApaH/serine/threonine PP2A family protein phosphatase
MLAVLYDVHGNLPALEAVLADAGGAGAERYLLGGDYALFGPWPAETVARLREVPEATWIRGNVDRWTANPDEVSSEELVARAVADCRRALGDQTADQLGELPESAVHDGVRFCHASPKSDMESFMPDPGDNDDELLAGASERRIVFGHTHLQFRRTREDGTELVNPGSVGLPLDGDHRAAYALIADDGSLELRRVAYDHERSAAALRELFGDVAWATRSQRRLLSARL